MNQELEPKEYTLQSRKYFDKIYNSFSVLISKKAIHYDFIFDKENNQIKVKNIDNTSSFPKHLTELLFNVMVADLIEDINKKHKLDESLHANFNSAVLSNKSVLGHVSFLLVELNEWILASNSQLNLDGFVDFKMRKYKNYLESLLQDIYEEEKYHYEHYKQAKEFETYAKKVFEENFDLANFKRLAATFNEEGLLVFKSLDDLELSIDFVQQTLGVVLQFDSRNGESEYTDLINRAKILQLFVTTLGVEELDITDVVNHPLELTIICDIFYSLCIAMKKEPVFINRNLKNENETGIETITESTETDNNEPK